MLKFCQDCGTQSIQYGSRDKIYCPKCLKEQDWPLEKDQHSMHGDRIGGTEDTASKSNHLCLQGGTKKTLRF